MFPKPNHRTQRQRRRKAQQDYRESRAEYLKRHPRCEVCRDVATEVHHKKGRGKHIADSRYFLAVCHACHMQIHANPAWSLEHGYMERR